MDHITIKVLFILVNLQIISSVPITKYDNLKNKEFKSLPFQDCGSKYEVLNVNIGNCDKIPCKLPWNSEVKVETEFNNYNFGNSNILKHNVHYVLNSVRKDATVFKNPSSFSEIGNGNKLIKTSLVINKTLPAVRGTLQWEINNSNNERVICFKLPINIIY